MSNSEPLKKDPLGDPEKWAFFMKSSSSVKRPQKAPISRSFFVYVADLIDYKKGWSYNRFPVALYMALANAGNTGGKAGSPNPVGAIWFSTK